MARIILGIGTSHTPMLNVGVDDWLRFEDLDRRRPHLHKDGRPATYDELLAIAPPSLQAELAPEKLAKRHAEAIAALERLHRTLIAARVDVVVVVGDDQKEIYRDDHMPSILVYRGETIVNVPNRTRATDPDVARRPDWARRASARYYEESETRHYPVHAKLANHLIAGLIDREFDVASANALPEGEGEGHAFGFVHRRIMKGAAIPVVPVSSTPTTRQTSRRPNAATSSAKPFATRSKATPKPFASGSSRQADSVTSPSTRRSTARSFERSEKKMPARCNRCRASSSILEVPRSATGFVPPVRSSTSICIGCTTRPDTARPRAQELASASPTGPDAESVVFRTELPERGVKLM
jgi:hypothetical protein